MKFIELTAVISTGPTKTKLKPSNERVVSVPGGYLVQGDSSANDIIRRVYSLFPPNTFEFTPLIIADPPYGNIVGQSWDKWPDLKEFVEWMVDWTFMWENSLFYGGAFYVWGGIGNIRYRPFFRYIIEVEDRTNLVMANLITWSKKRAYGLKYNYLFTREELAYFVKGDIKQPRCFNIPLLDTKRGYAGYNAKYPAKSEFYRRTNVWTDITEILRGKEHECQKPERLAEIMIETHTVEGEWVLDPFAGSGSTGVAAKKLGRQFVLIENDVETFEKLVEKFK